MDEKQQESRGWIRYLTHFVSKRTAIIAGVFLLIVILLVFFIVAMQMQRPQEHRIKEQLQVTRDLQSGPNSVLESLKRYLKENGIDCAHENTYSTYKSLTIDPQNPNIIYVGIEGRGVYKSEDKGQSWKKIVKGLVAYPDMNDKNELCFPDISSIYIDPANTKRLLLITADITTSYVYWPYGETGGIWESLDAGQNWRQIVNGEINVAGSGSLAVDPKNLQIMYYPVNPDSPTFLEAPIKESLNKKGSVYKTVDGGKTWQELEMPMLPGLQAMAIFIDHKSSNHILFFTQSHDHMYDKKSSVQAEVFLYKQHGILETFDGGKTWTALGKRLPAPYRALFDGDVAKNNFNHLLVRPFLFGPEFPGDKTVQKSFYSVDGGKSFHETQMYIWVGRYSPHDKEGNHLLGSTPTNARVLESKDAGRTWEEVATPPEVISQKVKITHFVWNPKGPNVVYMSGDYGNVWKSMDGGKSWKNVLNLNKLPK